MMIELTKERIEQFIKSPLDHGLTRSEQMEMARQLLAGMEQEPVYQVLGDGSWTDYSKQQLEDLLESKPSTLFRVAYAAPQLPQPAVVVNRKAIADRVHGQCSRIPGATFYNAAELALDEVEACRAAMLQGASTPFVPVK